MAALSTKDVGALLVLVAVVTGFVWLGYQTVQKRLGYEPLPWLPTAACAILAGFGVAGIGSATDSDDLGAFLLGIGGSMAGAGIVALLRGGD